MYYEDEYYDEWDDDDYDYWSEWDDDDELNDEGTVQTQRLNLGDLGIGYGTFFDPSGSLDDVP